MTQQLSRRKKIAFSLAPFLILAVLGLVAEGALRLTCPSLAQSYYTRIDKTTRKGYTGGHPIEVNRYRMREVDFPDERPPGERRVLCLGDSITQGYGLAAASAWPKVLEKILPASPQERVFCINAAGTGATTQRQMEFYRETARKFGASTVVVGFCMNDVRTKDVKSDVYAETEGKAAKSVEWRSELRSSYLFAAVDLGLTEFTKRYIYPRTKGQSWLYAYPYQVNAFGVTPQSDLAWGDTLNALRELHADVGRDGARLVVAAFPYQFQVSDDRRDNPYRVDKSTFRIDPFDKLKAAAAQDGYEFVDLGRAFGERRAAMLSGSAPWDPLFIDFCHPNEAGQELAAREIARALAAFTP